MDLGQLDTYARGYKPAYSNSSSNSMDWQPTQSNVSHMSSDVSPRFSTWLPGTMVKLPLELVLNILDEVLIGQSNRLSHASLHGLLSLRAASKHTKAMVDSYMKRDVVLTYLRRQLFDQNDPSCVKWYQSRADASRELWPSRNFLDNNPPNELPGCDVITDTIVDDCPECFDTLCTSRSTPGLISIHEGYNENGRNFIGIALQSGSYRMLQRFFLSACSPCALDSLSSTLLSSNNCLEPSPSILGMLAYQQDPVFTEQVLDLVGPAILQTCRPNALSYTFGTREKNMLCKYITARTGEWLTHLGVKLWERTLYSSDSFSHSASAWHSAVHNGPEFMEFLDKYSPTRPMFTRTLRGSLPIDHAVWANKLDSFRWLFAKMQLLDIRSYQTAIDRLFQVVANHTSPESEVMLEEIFLGPGSERDHFYVASLIFKNVALGLQEVVLNQAVRSDMDQKDLDLFRGEHEQRAIRKCLAVSRAYFKTDLPMKILTAAQANAQHFDAVRMAKQWGFEYLESTLYSYHGF
ncbi:hypothetical protein N7533_001977 [Penicillium manginii]|uniref:uncharacterized protein n=1 Tax=Penicillium manginii TaxID=203109 RepID=UPI002547901D|nr:uncharacterized protein N7533_001977 [Penicillium manginii]KAJ5763296.1 hypothetical protein N7533_001977 [Penicillium manginii]